MGQHVEQFSLALSLAECAEACHRALRSVDWQELPTDTLEVKAPMVYDQSDAGCLISLLEVVPAFRRRLDRVRTLTFHAPAGPPGSQAEIAASWRGGGVMVRISLRERAGFGTETTISGSGATGVSSAVRELRHSIEIQAGSLTPYRRRPEPVVVCIATRLATANAALQAPGRRSWRFAPPAEGTRTGRRGPFASGRSVAGHLPCPAAGGYPWSPREQWKPWR